MCVALLRLLLLHVGWVCSICSLYQSDESVVEVSSGRASSCKLVLILTLLLVVVRGLHGWWFRDFDCVLTGWQKMLLLLIRNGSHWNLVQSDKVKK